MRLWWHAPYRRPEGILLGRQKWCSQLGNTLLGDGGREWLLLETGLVVCMLSDAATFAVHDCAVLGKFFRGSTG